MGAKKNKLHVIATFMREGLVIFDPDKKISYANPKAHQLLGVSNLLGKTLQEILDTVVHEDGSVIEAETSGVMKSLKRTEEEEEEAITFYSKITGLWMTGTSISLVLGKTTKAIAFFNDITHLRQLENLEKTQMDLSKKDLCFQMISHDLKTPLTAITLAAHLLKKIPEAPFTARHVETILKSTTFMCHLIDELLTFSRMSTHALHLNFTTVKVEDILNQVRSQFELESELKKINLVINKTKITCHCDPERLCQILINLLGNAIKFSKEKGTVSLEIKETDDHTLFSVKDNGPGIPVNQLEKVFEPYHQVEQHKGHGLGLAIVKRIVDAHRGKVWVESQEGVGTCFHVLIPKEKWRDLKF